jgi:hypothetical protein
MNSMPCGGSTTAATGKNVLIEQRRDREAKFSQLLLLVVTVRALLLGVSVDPHGRALNILGAQAICKQGLPEFAAPTANTRCLNHSQASSNARPHPLRS